METPNVTVTVDELTDENVQELLQQHTLHDVTLGDEIDKRLNGILAKLQKHAGRRFLLRWTGRSNMPIGAKVLGNEVVWVQHCIVKAKRGEQPPNVGGNMFLGPTEDIGTYISLLEFGGQSGDEHVMVVYMFRRFC